MATGIDKHFRVRVPFWARWLGELRARKAARLARRRAEEEKRRFRYVALIHHATYWTDSKHHDYVHYLLEEDGRGNRRASISCTNYLLERGAKTNSTYLRTVLPWMDKQYSNAQMVDLGRRNHDNELRWSREDRG